MEFEAESIDFLKTYKNLEKRYGTKTVCRKSFCAPIIRMADSVITTYFDEESVKGVKKCLSTRLEEFHGGIIYG